MKSEYRIGTVWGIPINLHISLLVVMAYLAITGAFRGGWVAFVFIIMFEVLFFSSIALHELGHSFVAIKKGCRVREITLMFIGGAAKMESIPAKPRDELQMAIAGPAVSLIIGILAIGLARLIPTRYALGSWAAYLIHFAGIANLILTGFNLLPAFPMDGGRVFRAFLASKWGRLRATRMAATTGKFVAVLFVFVGIFGLPGVPFLGNGSIGLLFIAGFVFLLGEREYRMVQVEELMRNRGFAPPPNDTFSTPKAPTLDDHTVLISPPPYAKEGPAQKVEIQRNRSRHTLNDIFNR